ncbi:hypothetical protein QJQ45_019590 [Haematococcus lacustris]|nr:hypothetical protein QJQ45_019590 [Haematococcus lacustris]
MEVPLEWPNSGSLGPTPFEYYDEDVEDDYCDSPLPEFNLLPPLTAANTALGALPAGLFTLLRSDPAITKAQQTSTLNKKTKDTEMSLFRSTTSFFIDASQNCVYADGAAVPAAFMSIIQELVAVPFGNDQDQLQRVYEWLTLRQTDLCVLLCAYVTHARNSRSKGTDGHGAKFTASSYVHRFNCIAHQLEVHHKMLLKEQPGKAVAGFTRPRFLVQGHSVWGELWDAVDGVCKLAAKAGGGSTSRLERKRAALVSAAAIESAQSMLDTTTPEGLQNQFLLLIGVNCQFRISELHGLKRHFFTIVKDSKDPAARDMFKVDYQACKNWQGGMKDAGRVPPEKFIVPNSEYVPTGDAYVDAKVRTCY